MVLEPTDYWRLRTLTADLERDQVTLALAQQRAETTSARRLALWTALAEKYSLDPTKPYRAHDDTCTLDPSTNGQP